MRLCSFQPAQILAEYLLFCITLLFLLLLKVIKHNRITMDVVELVHLAVCFTITLVVIGFSS
jgi:hypothetical protein